MQRARTAGAARSRLVIDKSTLLLNTTVLFSYMMWFWVSVVALAQDHGEELLQMRGGESFLKVNIHKQI